MLINKNVLNVKTTELSLNELFETFKQNKTNEFRKLINEIEIYLAVLEKEEQEGKRKKKDYTVNRYIKL